MKATPGRRRRVEDDRLAEREPQRRLQQVHPRRPCHGRVDPAHAPVDLDHARAVRRSARISVWGAPERDADRRQRGVGRSRAPRPPARLPDRPGTNAPPSRNGSTKRRPAGDRHVALRGPSRTTLRRDVAREAGARGALAGRAVSPSSRQPDSRLAAGPPELERAFRAARPPNRRARRPWLASPRRGLSTAGKRRMRSSTLPSPRRRPGRPASANRYRQTGGRAAPCAGAACR